jgi:hypothetical protein
MPAATASTSPATLFFDAPATESTASLDIAEDCNCPPLLDWILAIPICKPHTPVRSIWTPTTALKIKNIEELIYSNISEAALPSFSTINYLHPSVHIIPTAIP